MDVLGIPPSTWVVLLTALIMLWSLCGLLMLHDRRSHFSRSSSVTVESAGSPHRTAQIYQFPAAQTRHNRRKGGGVV